ncbi:MAG: TolC family protein [Planctomycetaceae bacterium]
MSRRSTIRRERESARPVGIAVRAARSLAGYAALVTALAWCGCSTVEDKHALFRGDDLAYYEAVAEGADPTHEDLQPQPDVAAASRPRTLSSDDPIEYWDLPLMEAIHYACRNSQVIRELGGAVLRAPEGAQTRYTKALFLTDPRFGQEAALSAFDAELSASAFFEKNDRALNNAFFGGGTRLLTQDMNVYQAQLAKKGMMGTEMAVRTNTIYDHNNAPGNQFPGAFTTILEGEVRQPLLQGGGLTFNRVAGPNGVPGALNGVLIAKVNDEINDIDFELGIRDFIADIENAYWDLYFAYRDLDARVEARDESLETWRNIQARKGQLSGGEADREAQSREQYFRFQEEVQNAFSGVPVDGTRTFNGSTGGTFRGTGGVLTAERRLRLLMGVPITDQRLVRTQDEPTPARVDFDWHALVVEAMMNRPELKRQKLKVRRRELELLASKNFLLPQLDAMGRYRFRGFGKHYLGYDSTERFDNAIDDLVSGDFQEWQLGVEFSMPLGFRKGHAAVQNAELALAKERAILDEQERQILHDLSNAQAEVDRAHEVMQTNFNRLQAARDFLDSLEAVRRAGRTVDIDRLLDAQRRLADSESRYYRARVEYALAIRNVNLEKGTLLEYHALYLADDPTPATTALVSAAPPAIEGEFVPAPAERHFEDAPPLVPEGLDDLELDEEEPRRVHVPLEE